MDTKKYIVSAGVVVALLAGVSSLAFAENMTGNVSEMMKVKESREMAVRAGTEMVLNINHQGKVLMRGTIESVGTNSIMVKSWGGSWTVNIGTDAKLLPGTDMSQFKAGDFVGVQGSINESLAWTVDATIIRNWTAKKAMVETRMMEHKERHNNEQEIKDVIKNESPKNWQGVATGINVDAKTFTLTMEGKAYTVNIVTDAKIVEKNFASTDLAKVKEGDTVRVWGPVTDTTISAYVLRDISLAMTQTHDVMEGNR